MIEILKQLALYLSILQGLVLGIQHPQITPPAFGGMTSSVSSTHSFVVSSTDSFVVSSTDYFVVNGKTIPLPYTDNYKDQDLFIQTDKQTYGDWDKTSVYFEVHNASATQNIAIVFRFKGNEKVDSVSELQKDVPYQALVDDYGDKIVSCESDWVATSTINRLTGRQISFWWCNNPFQYQHCSLTNGKDCTIPNQIIGSHFETRYADNWNPSQKISYAASDSKRIPSDFKANTAYLTTLNTGETKYFKADISFAPKMKNEFWVEAYGSLGSYGSLDPWWDSSFGYRIKITTSNATTTETQTNFPVLVNLNSSRITYANASNTGADIRFVDSDGSTQLSYEIEKWDTSGTSTVWVKKPTVSSTSYFYMYYGNSSAVSAASSTAVWDSNFIAVHHMILNGNGSSTDSTGKANGSLSSGITTATGKINGALNFTSTTAQQITIIKSLSPMQNMTWSTWIYDWNISKVNQVFIGSDVDNSWNLFYNYDCANKIEFAYKYGENYACISNDLPQSQWTHIVATYDGTQATNSNRVKVYIDGVSQSLTFNGAFPTSTPSTSEIWLSNLGANFAGIMDEARISSSTRSAGWIWNEYKAGTDGMNSYGSEESNTTYEQESFRFRNDDNSETLATWMAAQDTTTTQTLNTNTRLRMIVNTSGTPSAQTFQLEYNKNSGSWSKVTTSTPIYNYPVPTLISTSTGSGTGAVSVAPPTGYEENDIFLAFIESATTTVGMGIAPSGWTFIASSTPPGSTGATSTKIEAYWRLATASESNTSWADRGDHTLVSELCFRGVATTTANPYDVYSSGITGTSTAIVATSSLTTISNNDLIVLGVSDTYDSTAARFSGWTNANLASITEVYDMGSTSGNGGGIGVMTGSLATAGAVGNTTITSSQGSSWHPWIYVSLRPPTSTPAVNPEIQPANSAYITSAAASSTTAQLTPPAGLSSSTNFLAGRISDDTNPLPSLSLTTTTPYTELEWNFIATSTAAVNDVFSFRVTNAGTALNTYSVTPTLTIVSAAAPTILSKFFLNQEQFILNQAQLIIQ